jgi:hypothetical protein
LGTFYDLVHQHDLQKALCWRLQWQVKPRTLFEISDIKWIEQAAEIGWETYEQDWANGGAFAALSLR